MQKFLNIENFRQFVRDESGTTATEYALIIGIVGSALVVSLNNEGHSITNKIDYVAGAIAGS